MLTEQQMRVLVTVRDTLLALTPFDYEVADRVRRDAIDPLTHMLATEGPRASPPTPDVAAVSARQRQYAAALGSAEQRARWDAGLLPDDELFAIARNELFRPFSRFHRRKRMIASDIPHPRRVGRVCNLSRNSIDWHSDELTAVSANEWKTVEALGDALTVASEHPWIAPHLPISMSLRKHVGTCQHCHRSAHQHSALVVIPFGGRNLSREYTLGAL